MGYIFVTRDEECVIVVVRREMYGLHFCNPRVLGFVGFAVLVEDLWVTQMGKMS